MLYSQRDGCLTEAFIPKVQIYKPYEEQRMDFVSM